MTENNMKFAFHHFDVDDTGTITIENLTYEDLGHFNSLSLISTLRVDGGVTKKPN